ncbi:MAG: hypothetical protein E7323_13555 [Clostridiales bacterium]|nr:hypothetical protein [Clostridiales bacterium]
MLTAIEFSHITGCNPVSEETFAALLADAEQQLHTHTLYAYVGRDMGSLPEIIRSHWQRALAWQVYFLQQQGGMAAQASGMVAAGFSIGDLTVNGTGSSGNSSSADGLSPTVRSLLPMLLAYGRGLRKCD